MTERRQFAEFGGNILGNSCQSIQGQTKDTNLSIYSQWLYNSKYSHKNPLTSFMLFHLSYCTLMWILRRKCGQEAMEKCAEDHYA